MLMSQKGFAPLVLLISGVIVISVGIVGGSFYIKRVIQDRKSSQNNNQIVSQPSPVITPASTETANQYTNKISERSVLLVSGIIHKNGKVEWMPFYRLPSGKVDETDPGSSSIQVLDLQGKLLYEITFEESFIITTHPPKEVDTSPFGFAVPYSAKAQIAQFKRGNQVLSKEVIASNLLRSAIDAIPESGFTSSPEESKKTLKDQVENFETLITKGDVQEASKVLKDNIRTNLEKNLKDNYQVKSPLEYTKPSILELVDELSQRLVNQ